MYDIVHPTEPEHHEDLHTGPGVRLLYARLQVIRLNAHVLHCAVPLHLLLLLGTLRRGRAICLLVVC